MNYCVVALGTRDGTSALKGSSDLLPAHADVQVAAESLRIPLGTMKDGVR